MVVVSSFRYRDGPRRWLLVPMCGPGWTSLAVASAAWGNPPPRAFVLGEDPCQLAEVVLATQCRLGCAERIESLQCLPASRGQGW